METNILWEPEIGTCGVCGEQACIRLYSSQKNMIIRKFCFPCWDSEQEPRAMSSIDWVDNDRVLFMFPAEEPPSKAA